MPLSRVVIKRVPIGELSTPPRNPRRFVVNRLARRAGSGAAPGKRPWSKGQDDGDRGRVRLSFPAERSVCRSQPSRFRSVARNSVVELPDSLILCLTDLFWLTNRFGSAVRSERTQPSQLDDPVLIQKGKCDWQQSKDPRSYMPWRRCSLAMKKQKHVHDRSPAEVELIREEPHLPGVRSSLDPCKKSACPDHHVQEHREARRSSNCVADPSSWSYDGPTTNRQWSARVRGVTRYARAEVAGQCCPIPAAPSQKQKGKGPSCSYLRVLAVRVQWHHAAS